MIGEPEWVTIAEAGRRLGLAERQARRWAERLPAEGRRQEEVGNGRSRALVRLDLLSALVSGHLSGHLSGQVSGQVSGQAAEPPAEEMMAVPLGLAMTAQRDALERVIAEQAARIVDLKASLEHEREAGRRLGEALAREQTLRMLERSPEFVGSSADVGSSAEPVPVVSAEPAGGGLEPVREMAAEPVPEKPISVSVIVAPDLPEKSESGNGARFEPDPAEIEPQRQIQGIWGRVWCWLSSPVKRGQSK